MLNRRLQVVNILLLASVIFAAQIPVSADGHHLLIRVAKFKRVDQKVPYSGVDVESSDVCLHYDALTYRGRSYFWSDAMSDGLFVEGGRSLSKIYQPYDLAFRAGWHSKRDDDETNNNLWGLFESGGKIWIGSNGLGVLEFDPRRRFWSRYDWQYQAQPGIRTYLSFVDHRYLFFESRGAWFVYSRQRNACAQLAIPLDSRIDNSHSRNGARQLQFRNSEAKRSYYATLEREFARLVPEH